MIEIQDGRNITHYIQESHIVAVLDRDGKPTVYLSNGLVIPLEMRMRDFALNIIVSDIFKTKESL